MPDSHHYPAWFPYCTAEYTMEACREMRDRAREQGYEVRIDSRGRHLAGDGQYHPFGKVFIRSPQGSTECVECHLNTATTPEDRCGACDWSLKKDQHAVDHLGRTDHGEQDGDSRGVVVPAERDTWHRLDTPAMCEAWSASAVTT